MSRYDIILKRTGRAGEWRADLEGADAPAPDAVAASLRGGRAHALRERDSAPCADCVIVGDAGMESEADANESN